MKKYFFILILNLLLSPVCFSQTSDWFKDITIEVGLQGLTHPYVQSADINGDFYPDILVGTSGIISGHSNTFLLYINVPDENSPNKRKFINYTSESGINISRIPGKPMREYDMAIFADVDNDGDMDVVSSIYYHRLEYVKDPSLQDKSEVFLNDGTGHFTIKMDAGLAEHVYFPELAPGLIDAVGLSFLDYNFDGKLDLYIATKFKDYAKDITFPDILMKGNGDGSFIEVTDAGVQEIIEPLYGVNVTDFDNDGWQDVITSPYCRTGGRVMKNLGDGSFIDVAQTKNYNAHIFGGDWYYDTNYQMYKQQPLCQWEAPVADFDNDGDMDILQCLVHGGYETRDGIREGHTLIAVNQGSPNFDFVYDLDLITRNASLSTHLGDYGGLWVDFENNGWQDVVICQGYYTPATDRVYMCIQRSDHKFYDVTNELNLMNMKDASNAQGCDFDMDGDMDIFVFHNSTDGSKLRLLRNDVANGSNWVSVKLEAPAGCNKDALGARVRVYSDSIAQIREIQTGMGHFGGQEPFILNFGMGEINGIDSIEVRWPMKNSQITKIVNPAGNTHLVINSDGFKEYLKIKDKKISITKFTNSRLKFGTINVGNTIDTTVSVINDGDTILKVSAINLNCKNANIFSFTDSNIVNGFALDSKQTKNISIRFSPSERKLYDCKLELTTDGNNGQIVKYDITGKGFKQEPLITVKNKTLFFESTKTYLDKKLQISNIGELDLIVDSLELFDDASNVFELLDLNTQGLFPLTIKAGSNWELSVRFAPKGKGNFTGKIKIKSNAYLDTNYVVNLSGVGDVPRPIAKFPVMINLNFNNVSIGQYKDTIIKIENIGDGDLQITSALVEDNSDNILSFFGMDFPLTVKPGNYRDLNIRFEPKEQISYSRKIHIYSNDEIIPDKFYNVKGKGIAPASVNEYENLDFDLSIKPNPVIDKFEIELIAKSNIIIKNLEVLIYNISGKLIATIYEGVVPDNKIINCNISKLSSGKYYVVMKYNDKKITLPLTKF